MAFHKRVRTYRGKFNFVGTLYCFGFAVLVQNRAVHRHCVFSFSYRRRFGLIENNVFEIDAGFKGFLTYRFECVGEIQRFKISVSKEFVARIFDACRQYKFFGVVGVGVHYRFAVFVEYKGRVDDKLAVCAKLNLLKRVQISDNVGNHRGFYRVGYRYRSHLFAVAKYQRLSACGSRFIFCAVLTKPINNKRISKVDVSVKVVVKNKFGDCGF